MFPFHVYGSWLSQIAIFVVLVITEFTVRFNVAMESHPPALIKLEVYVPDAFNVWPFQMYGSWLLQIVVFVVLVAVAFTVKFNVAMESHPAELCRVVLYEPATLYALSFHIYGSWLSQITIFVVLVTTGFTVKFNVAMESQPAELIKLEVYVPVALMDWLFQI